MVHVLQKTKWISSTDKNVQYLFEVLFFPEMARHACLYYFPTGEVVFLFPRQQVMHVKLFPFWGGGISVTTFPSSKDALKGKFKMDKQMKFGQIVIRLLTCLVQVS